MRCKCFVFATVLVFIAFVNGARGQDPAPPGADVVAPTYSDLEAESLPRELLEDVGRPPAPRLYGPAAVSEVDLLNGLLKTSSLYQWSGIRTFGWVEGGYTGASVRPGLLNVETRQNRFGDEFLLNPGRFHTDVALFLRIC